MSKALLPTVPAALEGLELGPIIGKGSYGSVYRGSYNKQHVAVKARARLLLAERLQSQPALLVRRVQESRTRAHCALWQHLRST